MAHPRCIDTLPLGALPAPFAEARRMRDLGREDVRDLLRAGPFVFLIANLGDPLRVIPLEDRFAFWKSEAEARIVESDRIVLEAYAGGLAYAASEWRDGSRSIVLLEAYH